MRQIFFVLLSGLLALGIPHSVDAQATRMSPELLWKLGRLGNPTKVNEDWVAFTVRRYELSENSGASSLFLKSIQGAEKKTLLEGWRSISDVQIAPMGKEETVIFFLGIPPKSEADSGDEAEQPEDEFASSPQLYRCDLEGNFKRLSGIEDGIANLKVSPTGKHVAFTRDIKLDAEVTELYEDLPKADARIIDQLMYRHWNAWHDYKYSHLHVAAFTPEGAVDDVHDLMEGMKVDCPVPPFGGSEQFAWSPAGDEICYTAKIVEDWAQSTDSDLYVVKLNADGSANGSAVCITEGQDGYDNNPFYSPDGKYLGYNSMQRPSFEADRNRVMLFDRAQQTTRDLTAGLDQNANHPHWTTDSQSVQFMSEYRGCNQLFSIALDGNKPKQLTKGPFNWDIVSELSDNRVLVTKTSMLRPAELYVLDTSNQTDKQVTFINDDIYKDLELPTVKERWVEATDGKKIHCWVIYPPGFDESKEYPLLTYCQGGPQGQIGQWFSYRWNFHLMASHGDYVIVAPNRRGLPGFGREWNDQISGDWGGQAMQDLLSATDNMLQEPYIDKARVGAIGASFGGYTVYWMMGNHEDRFATMIAHCGVFNLESMYGSTEELFFVNWDLGGPYWGSPESQNKYNQFSPHRFVKNWKTPLLVIHGEKDFRVPVTQGMEAFTAAQVQGVDSRFLYFPEEGHWVMSPQNGVLWHRVFFDWLGRELKP
jgi:dipeptidyl aminopeptidase/acylaminoacyl peptidase